MNGERFIADFSGEYRFLSNFFPSQVSDFQGFWYPTVEHAYQALKTLNLNHREKISNMATPGEAKKFGQIVQIRPDWDKIKYAEMVLLLRQKFRGSLKKQLLETHPKFLVEGNTWGDNYWGWDTKEAGINLESARYLCEPWCSNNHLGRALMLVREECRIEKMIQLPTISVGEG
jgi:ribA/ribD-fused uncharacterized protein